MLYSKADLDNSVKLIDKRDNKIYGLLIFSEYPINIGSPIEFINPILSSYLKNYKQLNGHSFIIDERLRGTTFDKRMLLFNMEFLEKYDLIWMGVEKSLKTHNYWKRLGFEEILDIDEAKFYIKRLNKKSMLDIFILKALSENENDYN